MTAAVVPVAEEAAGAAGATSGAAGARGGAAASGAAGPPKRNKGKGKGGKGRSRQITSDMSADEVTAELQRRKDEAAAPKDDDEHQDEEHDTGDEVVNTANRMDPVHTGSGAVLGVLVFVVFRNYVEGGMPQVRRWLRAKFLNKTS